MIEYEHHFINGRFCPVSVAGTTVVHDCATEEAIGQVAHGSSKNVSAAVSAARNAAAQWRATSVVKRAKYLRLIADALERRGAQLAQGISREVGMPLKLCQRIQVDAPIAAWRAMADTVGDFQFAIDVGHSIVMHESVGVVAAITPWNYPLHQITGKLAPALAAGCTVVLKPSELAPTTARMLMEAVAESGIPAGVVNVVLGDAVTGRALVEHPGVEMVSFTGSTSVGRQIASTAAALLKRISLELGGKSASVVLDDADMAQAVRHAVSSCFLNSGQTCSAITRLLVPEDRYEECRALVAGAVARLKVGDPGDSATRIGPLISASQRSRVLAIVKEAEAAGFDLIAGGSTAAVPAIGYFVAPTAFGRIAPDSQIAQEEVFGPVLAVLTYDNETQAISLANGTKYGLAGAVWSASEERARRVACEIRAGQVDVNGAVFNPADPFGGFACSGMGREGGTFGLAEFLEPRAIQLNNYGES